MHCQTDGNSPYSPSESASSVASSNSPSYSNGHSPAGFHQAFSVVNNYPGNKVSPCLAILNQPQGKFRFRYVSEMTGTHGCLMAESNDRNKKEYIRVQLFGCQEKEAIIRCTLVTNSPNPVPHVHRLGGDGSLSNGSEGDHQDIPVSASKNEWIATFSGLTIIHTAKKQVRETVVKRLMDEKKGERLNRNQGQQLKDEADKIATTMDLHSVKLKFEAFVERQDGLEPIAPPVYSQAIHNLKSTHAGDLRIVRIDKVYSCCTGQEEIFIFVEKVNKKDIKIRFFETDESGDSEIWEAYADFSELDVHHQYAIAFKTPPYHNQNIDCNVTVQFQLKRPSNGATSEAKSFTYIPREKIMPRGKRRYEATSNPSPHPPKGAGSFSSRTSPNSDNSSIASELRSPFFSGNGDASQDSTYPPYGQPQSHNNGFGTAMDSVAGPDTSIMVDPSNHNQLSDELILFPNEIRFPAMYPMSGNPVVDYSLMDFSTVGTVSRGRQVVGQQLLHPPNQQPGQKVVGSSHLQSNNNPTGVWSSSTVGTSVLPSQSGMQMGFVEVNMDQNEDDLLRMIAQLSELDDFQECRDLAADASGSFPCAQDLRRHSTRPIFSSSTKPLINDHLKSMKPSSVLGPATSSRAVLESYSLCMALAVRLYAETGDLTHVLCRLPDLMALQNDDGDNALHVALYHNQVDALRAMLKAASVRGKGQKFVNSTNNFCLTPLHVSVMMNQTEATALLLQNGANPNLVDANGNTAFHLAAADEHLLDCMQLLLASPTINSPHGNRLDVRNYAGLTPLLVAVSKGNVKCLELLLSGGADVNCCETKRGRSSLHLATKKNAKEIVVRLLDEPSILIDAQSYDGSTALHLAAVDGLPEICALLVDRGADPTLSTYIGSSSISDCTESDLDEEVDEAEVCEDKKGQSPLDLAQPKSMVSSILRAIPNEKNLEKSTQSEDNIASNTGSSFRMTRDSGIDLTVSKELSSKVLDSKIIMELARMLDTPNRDWEALADSLGLGGLRLVFEKHPQPAGYFLENLDLWEIPTQSVLEKLHELKLREAAAILEDYLLC